VIEDLPAGVIGVSAVGTIRGEDYEQTLIPMIGDAVSRHGKIAAVIVFGPEFERYAADAALDDMWLGVEHTIAFRRIAIVSDNEWLRNGAAASMYLFPGKAKGFSYADLAAAKSWAAERD
jgi:hypothetical protein